MPGTPDHPIPDNFARVMAEVYSTAGAAWIQRLPDLIAEIEQQWAIRVLPPFNLSYNYVAPAITQDGGQAVLKLGYICKELLSEIYALQTFNGRGMVRLLHSSTERGAMLLERVSPGMELADLADDDAETRIAAEVMRDLWVPAPEDPQGRLCQSRQWAQGLDKLRATFDGTGPFPAVLVERSERLFEELFAGAGPDMLLHGDLHHWNILSANRRPWLALDPKGLIGEAEYEVGALMRNKFPENGDQAAVQKQASRRLDILHEVLGFDKQRMLDWTVAQGLLSAWWTYEDHHEIAHSMIFFAEALAAMRLKP